MYPLNVKKLKKSKKLVVSIKTFNYPTTRNGDKIVTFDVFQLLLLQRMISHQYAKLPKGK